MDGGEKNPVAATSSGCLARAVTLHLAGKREEALKQLQRTVDVGEASPEIYRAMGHIQFELDAFADAAASYRSLTGIKPQYAKGWFNLAVCLERLDDWDGASQAFHKASTLDPSHLEAHLGLGVSHLRLEDPKSALFAFDRCLVVHAALDPGDRSFLLDEKWEAQCDMARRRLKIIRSVLQHPGEIRHREDPLMPA